MKEEVFVRRTMLIKELDVSSLNYEDYFFNLSEKLKRDLSVEVEIFLDRVMIICNDLYILSEGTTVSHALSNLSATIINNFNLLNNVTDECLDKYFLDLRDKYCYYLELEE